MLPVASGRWARGSAGDRRYPSAVIPTWRTLALVLAFVALVGACSGGAAATPPARTVDVITTDTMRFEPAQYDFAVGDRVLFRVQNTGKVIHEFYVGTSADQATHETEMQAGAMAHDHANGVSVEPGQSKTLELTFARAGTLEVGCHVAGHWDAGMRGTITVK